MRLRAKSLGLDKLWVSGFRAAGLAFRVSSSCGFVSTMNGLGIWS